MNSVRDAQSRCFSVLITFKELFFFFFWSVHTYLLKCVGFFMVFFSSSVVEKGQHADVFIALLI